MHESLSTPIAALKIEDPHLHKEYEEDKLSILDILATLNDGTKVNIEIQLRNTQEIIKRSLYYWSKLYTSQLEKGMSYRSLRKTIAISLLDFHLFPDYEDMHTIGQFWSRPQKQDPMLQKAIHKWENMSQSSSFRLAYEAREKVLFDEQAKLAHAREVGKEEGKEEGLQEGIQQGKRLMILGMHRLQVPIETIAQASELTIEKVQKIIGEA
ncbi:Rpn family recombination-promoting nuclease/putative transposase [Bacillus mycoides]|uniref:Rpn family recombination-promoting nuclease/putative transposase n=1 Tax=Bacillus mycoides TaxID=1405 RepID=UPI00211338B5|nr:Rpn family recombination-promoting nuclease/putative transposase [Bacillus mycoides]MCQ6530832.1 Rpn family recombination-promoting nuclease/putative transposase [Bacillus mycoides]